MLALELSKREFLQQYVLNRAITHSERGLSGDGAAVEAIRAWDRINKACPEPLPTKEKTQ